MDAGLAVTPSGFTSATDNPRAVTVAAPAAAATDLPENQTVTPSRDAGATRHDTPQPDGSRSAFITHSLTIDPQTRDVIYRVMDMRTHQVLWQVPDAALLRSRAYARTLAAGTEFAAKAKTDVTE